MAQPPAYAGLRSRSSGPNATDRRAITDDLLHAAVRLAGHDQDMLARIEAIVDGPRDPPTMGEAALGYAARGIGVFPLVPGEKRPLVKHGLHEATIDTATVAAWWARWPQANIGMPTGTVADVIDVDGTRGVIAIAGYLESIRARAIGIVSTPRPGGLHYYVPPAGDRKNSAGKLLNGVDTRAAGGYVILPPSVTDEHGPGRRYTWLRPLVAAG